MPNISEFTAKSSKLLDCCWILIRCFRKIYPLSDKISLIVLPTKLKYLLF